MHGQLEILGAAWSQAGHELSVELVAPFRVGARQTDLAVAFVPLFGSDGGTIVDFRGSGPGSGAVHRYAGAHGCYYSQIYFDVYCAFDRSLWEETLNDWGWYGPLAETPTWFTGISYGT